jgi:IMP dehydrogenase
MKFKLKQIEKVSRRHYKGKVHDLCVENHASYNIKGVIVHNSACTTRLVTGHGMPTLASVMDCAEASAETGVPMIADGGFRNSGDVVKALAFGASSVCVGNILAGTSETPGTVIELPSGEKFKEYYGMSSKTAQDRHKNGKRRGIAAEGIDRLVPFKGGTEEVLLEIIGGTKAGLAYSGAYNIQELRDTFEYMILSPGAMRESKLG